MLRKEEVGRVTDFDLYLICTQIAPFGILTLISTGSGRLCQRGGRHACPLVSGDEVSVSRFSHRSRVARGSDAREREASLLCSAPSGKSGPAAWGP